MAVDMAAAERRELNAYAACGIHNCHESVGLDEAREKEAAAVKRSIRPQLT